MPVTVSVEGARGCGYRKSGANGWGLYLMADGPFAPCEKLPFPLHVCPVCGHGIKSTRGFTWIEPANLFADLEEQDCESPACGFCPLGNFSMMQGQHGLLWVGEKFYRSAESFQVESNRMGISRKISTIPQGFKLGSTWIFLAHRKAVYGVDENGELERQPGVFMVFKPQRLDVVIDDENNVPEYAQELQKQYGEEKCRIVKVIRDIDMQGQLL